jgi:hypothetical protein
MALRIRALILSSCDFAAFRILPSSRALTRTESTWSFSPLCRSCPIGDYSGFGVISSSYFTFGIRLAYTASFTINFSWRIHEHSSGIKT